MTDQQPVGHFRAVDIDNYHLHFKPEDHVLVDVRELEEWVTGHIPWAIHIPLNDLPERMAEIPVDKPVVVVCASGVRSIYGAQFLLGNGYPEVYTLDDGTKGWIKKHLPIEV